MWICCAMNSGTSRILGAFFLLIFCAGSLWAQTPSSSQSGKEAAYLMRLERVREGLDVCVLVRGDGQYHLERHLSEKSKILEGNLDADETRQVIRIVSDDQLFLLRQDGISESMLRSKFDEVRLAVFRPQNHWQVLEFPDPVSREPYRKSLDPLLNWLEKLEKRKGQELSEDSGRNSCSPPRDVDLTVRERNLQKSVPSVAGQTALQKEGDPPPPQLKTRNAQDQSETIPQLTSRPAQGPESSEINTPPTPRELQTPAAKNEQYLLRIVESLMYPRVERATCSVISHSGLYHVVSQNHDPGSSKVHNAVLDGRLNEAQLTSLGKILDAPELSKVSSHESQDLSYVPPISLNGFFMWISFLREGTTYNYEISRPFRFVGRSAIDKAQEKELQAFGPLFSWLKKNMDLSKSPPTSTLSNSRCAEVP
jgi:hypothetical protein